MKELAFRRAKEYLVNHPDIQPQDTEAFIDAFRKGYQSGFDDLAELINTMWKSK